jgi:hypothetical protein
MLSIIKDISNLVKAHLIQGIFDVETIDPDNGGPECEKYMSFEFRLITNLTILPFYFLFFKLLLNNLRKHMESITSKEIIYASVFEKLLGYFTFFVFCLHCFYKINSKQLIFMLNPCHVVNLIEAYLLLVPNSINARLIYTVLMNTLFSPWIAIIFPVTCGLDAFLEVPMFWVEHMLAGVINPIVLTMSHRYYKRDTISIKNHLFAHMIFGIYQRLILFPVSQMCQVNLNYLLCGSKKDPFEPFIGKWYYIISDYYIFIGGEIFHRIWQFIFEIVKFAERKIYKIVEKKELKNE